MHVHLRMIGKETFNSVRLMCRKIVQDDMNLFVSGLTGNNVGEKGDEFRTGMTLCGLSQDLTALGVKRSVKRQRSVAKYSNPWRSARPALSGRTGSLRSKAWMAVFSSTENTAACWGGCK